MENLWKIYGKSMENLWKIYGKSMEDLWKIYGKSMENLWLMVNSMGDLQDPIDGATSTYHFLGHILLGYSLKLRPKIYGIGTSNKSVPEMAIE